MSSSKAGLQRLSFDNLHDDSSRHADISDRQQTGASPNSNYSNAATSSIADTGAVGMTCQKWR